MNRDLKWLIPFFAILSAGCTLESLARRCGRNDGPAPASIASVTSAPATSARTPIAQIPSATNGVAAALPINPQNTTISFVGASGLNKQSGSFGQFGGQMQMASNDPATSQLALQIEMSSVTTKIPLLSKHLKRFDFFDVEHFPTASFVSTHIEPAQGQDATHVITGDMTMHGVTRTLTIPARFNVSADLAMLDATFTIRQSEFGMEKAARKTDDIVPVTIAARLPLR